MSNQLQLKENACNLAKSLLKSEAEYLDKVIKLYSIGNSLYRECWGTEFHIFGVISSDTDHLPVGKVRKHCSKSMLEKSGNELKSVIEFYKNQVESACNEILSKHQDI